MTRINIKGKQVASVQENSIEHTTENQQARELLSALDKMIGLQKVKNLVKEIYAFIEIQQRREKENLLTEPTVLHMIFKGNPGTGKTTVARFLGSLFFQMGILKKGHIVEVERADLVGEYIGHTALKTREKITSALDGILFIDEAYSLARGGEKDFGKEAIDTLVKAMEDNRGNLIVILAGYEREMETFLRANPGLRSRFPIHLTYPDYSITELLSIAESMLAEREYRMTLVAKNRLRNVLLSAQQNSITSEGNARMVRNYIEKAIRTQALRLVKTSQYSREDLITINEQDIALLESDHP